MVRISTLSTAMLAILVAAGVPLAEASAATKASVGSHHRAVCPRAPAGSASCASLVVTAADGVRPLATSAPTGYGPADLAGAYGYPGAAQGPWVWNGKTVAIVDAFDNPNADVDLAAYRSAYRLPPCTSASGCFRKTSQSKRAKLPVPNVGWGQEIDLDTQMVSAVCPGCKILLVEANSASFSDLGTAVNRAVALGANAVTNSYAGSESFLSSLFEGPYNHPGVAVTASAGDAGYGSAFPASSPHVVAVGGTSLQIDPATKARVAESAWSGGGSWCSDVFAQPSWQNAAVTADPSGLACTNRTVADVAAVADPNTGVAVYDSYGSTGGLNWYRFGGTSVSSPIVAALFARAGDAIANPSYPYPAKHLYDFRTALFDVTSGYNGNATNDCWPNTSDPYYLCHADPTYVGERYDAPTGVGTPAGLGGF